MEQRYLRSVLHYCPDTGVFTWLIHKGRAKIGSTAGSITLNGYKSLGLNKKRYYLHRLAFLYMNGAWPSFQVDHIDGDRANNTWSNLRDASQTDNSRNQKIPNTNTSGVVGVGWCNQYCKWVAQIQVHKKHKFLGRYDEFDNAVNARKAAERLYGFHENHGSRK